VKSDRTDLYRVLQVDPSANPLVIQAAYRALAQIFHPDVSGDAEEMKRLNAAWEVLGDAQKRRQYDIERAGRHAPQAPGTGPSSSHAAPPRPQPAAAPTTHRSAGATSTTWSASAATSSAPTTAPRQEDHAGPPVGPATGSVIRFGRYEGWTVGQVARTDPPFLEWLRRVPLGRALKPEIDLALQRADGARRMGLGAAGSGASNDQPVHTWAPGAPTRVR
jgi:curved DNA-binding protein CbpA